MPITVTPKSINLHVTSLRLKTVHLNKVLNCLILTNLILFRVNLKGREDKNFFGFETYMLAVIKYSMSASCDISQNMFTVNLLKKLRISLSPNSLYCSGKETEFHLTQLFRLSLYFHCSDLFSLCAQSERL